MNQLAHHLTAAATATLLPSTQEKSQPAVRRLVRNIGEVSEMTLPAGWLDGIIQEQVVGSSYFREFKAPHGKARLCFFFRGRPLGEPTGIALKQVLKGASSARELRIDELKSLAEMLQDKSFPLHFSMLSARVDRLSGRAVIIVQGRYKGIREDALHIYFDAQGRNGSFVQEIYFQASSDCRAATGESDFVRYIRQAKESINSVIFR